MIEKINELVGKINDCESEIIKTEKELLETEMERLNKVVKVAIKGIKFDKIYSNFITYNNFNEWYDDEYIFHKDRNEKFLKGVIVDKVNLSYNDDSTGGNKSERELFLMNDGTFKVFYHTGNWSCWQGDSNTYKRKISINQDITQFNFDSIIENIISELNDRLNKLGTRTKAQSLRLEKLKNLEIK